MSNPWLTIPLEDYEGHMGSAPVQQSHVLSDLFRRALLRHRPQTLAVLGVAGGNGLEHVDPAITSRVVGVDINQRYLDAVRRRFQSLPGLELHCCDLNQELFNQERVDLHTVELVYAALVFEHAGIGRALENALSLVAPSGTFCVVLQLPSTMEQAVAPSSYASMQSVKQVFAFIDVDEFPRLMEQKGFRLSEQERRPLPAGKAFWFGAFTRSDQPSHSSHTLIRFGIPESEATSRPSTIDRAPVRSNR
jgi:ubiquinone/menaquinone biosynthesis C-methylase UbiE